MSLLRGANREPQPDFADPLGDRDEHDVHDADPANQERHGRDSSEQNPERPRRVLLGPHHFR
jgi:hypothetical protein